MTTTNYKGVEYELRPHGNTQGWWAIKCNYIAPIIPEKIGDYAVVGIAEYAFTYPFLVLVDIQTKDLEIAKHAFYGCRHLKTLRFTDLERLKIAPNAIVNPPLDFDIYANTPKLFNTLDRIFRRNNAVVFGVAI